LIPHITIDGPTASGKGTIAQAVAQALGWHLLDSGSIYRACALHALNDGIALQDVDRLAVCATGLPLTFNETDGSAWLDGTEVTTALRAERVGSAASQISAIPAVRAALMQRQRDFLQEPGLVADGRDMGTVVFPDAPLKIFLTASAHARAERRYKQLNEKGISVIMADLVRDLVERDQRDTERAIAPLKPAPDAHMLDSSAMSIDEVTAQVLAWWRARASNQ
jgi:cytidylate kinase